MFSKQPLKRNKGASLLEYSLLAALLAGVCILAIQSVGERTLVTNGQLAIVMACANVDSSKRLMELKNHYSSIKNEHGAGVTGRAAYISCLTNRIRNCVTGVGNSQ